jgi:hypothetical protein
VKHAVRSTRRRGHQLTTCDLVPLEYVRTTAHPFTGHRGQDDPMLKLDAAISDGEGVNSFCVLLAVIAYC